MFLVLIWFCLCWHQELVVFWIREHWTGLWARPQYPSPSRRELVTISLLVERLGLWGVGMIVAQHLWQISLGFVSALVYWKLQSFVMPAADLHGWGIINYIIFNWIIECIIQLVDFEKQMNEGIINYIIFNIIII